VREPPRGQMDAPARVPAPHAAAVACG